MRPRALHLYSVLPCSCLVLCTWCPCRPSHVRVCARTHTAMQPVRIKCSQAAKPKPKPNTTHHTSVHVRPWSAPLPLSTLTLSNSTGGTNPRPVLAVVVAGAQGKGMTTPTRRSSLCAHTGHAHGHLPFTFAGDKRVGAHTHLCGSPFLASVHRDCDRTQSAQQSDRRPT